MLLNLGPLVLGTVLTLAAVIAALVISRRADSEWAPAAVVGGGTVLGLSLLGLTLAITASATDPDGEGPPSTTSASPTATPTNASVAAVASDAPSGKTGTPIAETVTATPTATPTPTPTPSPSPTPTATPETAGPPPTRYIQAAEGGVRWRSACAPEALLAGWWPNSTQVEVMRASPEGCGGWSLVRSGSLVSWVDNELLVESPAAPPTTTPSPTPTSTAPPASTPSPTTPTATPAAPAVGAQGSYGEALQGWVGRLREIEAALDSSFDRAVSSRDWSASSTNATRLGTAAVAVRTEIEQTAPFVSELAPGCSAAMAPLGEMAEALVQMAAAYSTWLADGLVDNAAGLRVSAQREALDQAESRVTAALGTCS